MSEKQENNKKTFSEKVTIIGLFWSSPIPRNPCEGHKKRRP